MFLIYGFDLTCTKRHTFQESSVDKCFDLSLDTQYEQGKTQAKDNLKDRIQEQISLDSGNLFAIAAFHNNPHFIAGYIAYILNKNLVWNSTKFHGTDPAIAIDRFHIEGEDQPVLISYIPKTGLQLVQDIAKLGNKNMQIGYLREEIISAGLMKRGDEIHFFDSTNTHIKAAKELSYVVSHWIHAKNPVFSERPLESTARKRICFFETPAVARASSNSAVILYQPERLSSLLIQLKSQQPLEPGQGNNLLEELTPDWLLEERSPGWCSLL